MASNCIGVRWNKLALLSSSVLAVTNSSTRKASLVVAVGRVVKQTSARREFELDPADSDFFLLSNSTLMKKIRKGFVSISYRGFPFSNSKLPFWRSLVLEHYRAL